MSKFERKKQLEYKEQNACGNCLCLNQSIETIQDSQGVKSQVIYNRCFEGFPVKLNAICNQYKRK